jgi:hypothetical protein
VREGSTKAVRVAAEKLTELANYMEKLEAERRKQA